MNKWRESLSKYGPRLVQLYDIEFLVIVYAGECD